MFDREPAMHHFHPVQATTTPPLEDSLAGMLLSLLLALALAGVACAARAIAVSA